MEKAIAKRAVMHIKGKYIQEHGQITAYKGQKRPVKAYKRQTKQRMCETEGI